MTIPGATTVSSTAALFLRSVETAVTFFVGTLVYTEWNTIHAGHITNVQGFEDSLVAAAIGAILATIKHTTGLTLSNVWGAAPGPGMGRRR